MLGALGVGAILGSAVVRRLQAAWGASGLVTVAAGDVYKRQAIPTEICGA